jgi:hypothetical protein
MSVYDENGELNAKHDHWSPVSCSHCTKVISPTVESLHMELVTIIAEVEELLSSLEAEQKLRDGFGGMGHNILVESAGRKYYQTRKLRRLIEKNKPGT